MEESLSTWSERIIPWLLNHGIKIGDADGTVENITLRLTTLRDLNGTMNWQKILRQGRD